MAKFVVVGATGFIGRHVVATLLERRHTVVGVHRGKAPSSLDGQSRFESVKADLTKMQKAESWTPILDGVDAVINCDNTQSAPPALFEACSKLNVTRFLQISDAQQDNEALTESDLDWVIVRPSLVYARGFFGGSSSLHSMAAFPGAILLPGDGQQKFQPIYIGDVVGIICELCEASSFSRKVIEPVGPETLTLKEILLKLRRWLDVPRDTTVSLPSWFLTGMGIAQIQTSEATTTQPFRGLFAPAARSMDDVLIARPANTGDRRAARFALLAPVITTVLFLSWIASGLLGFAFGMPAAEDVVTVFGLSATDPRLVAWITSGWNVLLGLVLLTPLRTGLLTGLQLLTVLVYTIVLSIAHPQLWLDPFGPLLKNIPILLLIGIWAMFRSRR